MSVELILISMVYFVSTTLLHLLKYKLDLFITTVLTDAFYLCIYNITHFPVVGRRKDF